MLGHPAMLTKVHATSPVAASVRFSAVVSELTGRRACGADGSDTDRRAGLRSLVSVFRCYVCGQAYVVLHQRVHAVFVRLTLNCHPVLLPAARYGLIRKEKQSRRGPIN